MIEINLLPDIKQEFVRAQRMKRVIISFAVLTSIATVGLVGLLLFWLFVVQGVRLIAVDNSIKGKTQQLNDEKNLTRNLTIQNQMASLVKLHEAKGDFSNLFEYLKTLNPADPDTVSMSKIVIDTNASTLTMEGFAGSFKSIGVFRDTLANAKISYITISGEKVNKGLLFSDIKVPKKSLDKGNDEAIVASFQIVATYDPNAFQWGIAKPVLTIPQKSTTPTASTVKLFSDQAADAANPVAGGAQ